MATYDYLNKVGLSRLWEKAKAKFADKSTTETELNKKFELPSGGNSGNFLAKTDSGTEWKNVELSGSDPSQGYAEDYISGTIDASRDSDGLRITYTDSLLNWGGIIKTIVGKNGATLYSSYRYLEFSFPSTGLYHIKVHLRESYSSSSVPNINGYINNNVSDDGVRSITFPGNSKPTPMNATYDHSTNYVISEDEYIFAVNDISETLDLRTVPIYNNQLSGDYEIKKIANLGGADPYFYANYRAYDTTYGLYTDHIGYTRSNVYPYQSNNPYNTIISNGITQSIASNDVAVITLPANCLYSINIVFSTNEQNTDNYNDINLGIWVPYNTAIKQIRLNASSSGNYIKWDPSVNNTLSFLYEEVRILNAEELIKIRMHPLNELSYSVNCKVSIKALEKF